jgi:hypothetical protein
LTLQVAQSESAKVPTNNRILKAVIVAGETYA